MDIRNRIIAEWIGWELCECGNKEPHYRTGKRQFDTIDVKDMRFHKSWDALKPIIDKIAELGIDNEEILLSDYYRNVCKYSITVRISIVYDDVIEFITWYKERWGCFKFKYTNYV